MKSIPKNVLVVGGVGLLLLFVGGGFSLIGLGLVGWAGWAWSKAGDNKITADTPKEIDYRALIEPLKYKSLEKHSGIGLDTENKILHLYEGKKYCAYPFSDIRKWSANIQTGGMTMGGGNVSTAIMIAASNSRVARDNVANTGFFVEVRDIDNPKWKINFPPKDLDKSHDRWMEIFRQYVNEE